MKTLIIDDELDAIKSLTIILDEYTEGITLVGTANSAMEGIKLINQHQPDLIFLDVEMPNGTGFELLEALDKRNFQVIFTTAYEHYAIQAIRANAIDYLMKPVDIDELVAAVKQAELQVGKDHSSKHEQLLETINADGIKRLPVSVKNEYLFLDVEDIQFIQSDGSYSIIHLDHDTYTTSKNLKHYERMLEPNNFLRASNSHLINLNKVTKYLREDGGTVELENRIKITTTRSRRDKLKEKLGI